MLNFRQLGDAHRAQPLGELRSQRRIRDRDQLGMLLRDLLRELVQILTGSKRNDAKTLGHGIHHVERLLANGTRRTQDGDLLHFVPSEYGKWNTMKSALPHTFSRVFSSLKNAGLKLQLPHHEPLKIIPDCGSCKNQRIDAVEHASMTGRGLLPRILCTGAALERRFENVSTPGR